jgi:hypothetical protein
MPVAGLQFTDICKNYLCTNSGKYTYYCAECGFLFCYLFEQLLWYAISEIFSGTKMLKFQNKKLANKAFDSTGSICLFDGV